MAKGIVFMREVGLDERGVGGIEKGSGFIRGE